MRKIRTSLSVVSLAFVGALLAGEPTPGKQVEQALTLSDGGVVKCLLYLPQDYSKTGKPAPMILFLHGRGESYGPLSLVAKWGPPRRLAAGEQMKYIVVSPQCPGDSFWSRDDQQKRLVALLAHIKRAFNVDEDRIYLTGLSMGGFGTWRLAADHPDWFAAAAPVCGRGNPADAPKLVRLPIWVWHGVEDRTVPFRYSEEMVRAIRAAGGKKVRFTTLEHIGHNAWQAAYHSDELYRWFDRQRASQNRP
ncbi:MAG: prolyl oligopeptidase family serine peptidase [Verrucomicrobia bacterium]|nr:prolyl oligopeptidase family serine peptidase [Verrucomicrobiota bacterium]